MSIPSEVLTAHLETLAIAVKQSLGTVDGAMPARRYEDLKVRRCQQHDTMLSGEYREDRQSLSYIYLISYQIVGILVQSAGRHLPGRAIRIEKHHEIRVQVFEFNVNCLDSCVT